MSLLTSQNIVLERRGSVRYIDGKIIQDQSLTVNVAGSIQPEKNITLIRETFGSHIEAALKLYTTEKLRTQEKGRDADVVIYDGRKWVVSQVRKYDVLVPHYRSIAILKKDEN